MGFQQGLSGLNSSSKALDVVGNNVSNSGTVGFKGARAEFADIYAASLSGAGGGNQVGIGDRINSVAQQFSQGNITSTNNALDVAINGNGFFVMSDSAGITSYTRNGQFKLDKDGYLINSDGLHIQGYPASFATNALGIINPTTPASIFIDPSNVTPQATSTGSIDVNLDARAKLPQGGHERFNPADPYSYGWSTSMPIYDSLGNSHTLSMYFVYAGTTTDTALSGSPQVSQWQVRYAIDGNSNPTTALPAVVPPATVPSPWTQSSTGAVATAGAAPTAGSIAGSAYVANALNAAGATLNLTVDGVALAPITLPAGAGLYPNAAAVQAAIAGDPVFAASGATVSVNPAGGITIASGTTGAASSVSVTGTNLSSVFSTAAPVATPGSVATAGSLSGNKYIADTADAGGTLSLSVDGNPVTVVIPPGTYANATSLATAINAGGLAGATATANTDGSISITSNTTGAASSVTITGNTFSDSVFGIPFAAGDNVTLAFDSTGKLVDYGTGGGAGGSATFQGNLTNAPSLTINMSAIVGQNKSATPLTITSLDFSKATQFGTSFGVNNLVQDGYATGRLNKISISQDGVIQGIYTNGQTRNMAQLVLARFTNPNGLTSIGGNQWQESFASGVPLVGAPGSGSNGLLQDSALEESTVDLTQELVNMITFQRAYQANAQTIKTQDSILQTITNLR
jgi:flagellar hook protein FlgE